MLLHALNLYEKPSAGDTFLKRFFVYNYRHKISAVGGFDTASCDIAIGSRDEGQQFLDQYLGNRVAFYVDNPVEPIWEGFINRMTFDAGGIQYSISLDEMLNRATITYTDPASSATASAITGTANDTDSQAVYGIKQGNIDYGYLRGGTASTAIRDTVLAQRAWPKSSITRGGGSGLLHLEMLGFYHTLDWEILTDTNTVTSTLSAYITLMVGADQNGTTFFDNTDTTGISANTGLSINREHIKRETFWAVYQRIREIGDSSNNYWIVGISPTDLRTGTRRLYYQQANSTIEYTARLSDGLRIRNLYGQLVPPWTVRPDAGIRVTDQLIGWDGLGDNPTETYILSVDYDANQQTIDYHGDDDLTAEGVFQLKRYGKPIGRRFGAPRRGV